MSEPHMHTYRRPYTEMIDVSEFRFFAEFFTENFAVALNKICVLILGHIPNRIGGGGSLAPGGGQASTGGQTKRGGLQVHVLRYLQYLSN
jgi:hypothetical protein